MMKYTTFVSGEAAEAPVAYALKYLGAHPFFRSVIVVGALTGMISSLLVFQYGQARIWYAMSRDGLLPKLFSVVHPKFKTPYWSTWIACFAVGIPAGLVDIGDAADLSNIGTLFAFVLVSLGVIFLRRRTAPARLQPFVLVSLISVSVVTMTGLTRHLAASSSRPRLSIFTSSTAAIWQSRSQKPVTRAKQSAGSEIPAPKD
jgi:amino acid transporter